MLVLFCTQVQIIPEAEYMPLLKLVCVLEGIRSHDDPTRSGLTESLALDSIAAALVVLLQWPLYCCCAKSALQPSLSPLIKSMVRDSVALVWVKDVRALLHCGVNSLPCKRRDPLASLRSLAQSHCCSAHCCCCCCSSSSSSSSSSRAQTNLISLCTSYHLIISTRT